MRLPPHREIPQIEIGRLASATVAYDLQRAEVAAKIAAEITPAAAGLPRQPSSPRQLHVFEIAGLVIDAGPWRGDPRGELAGLGAGPHQARDKRIVVG